MKHPLVLLVLLLFAGKILAQAPQITSVSPAGMSLTATTGTALTAIFNEPLDPASVNETTFRIFGKWSGPAKGDFTFSQNQTQVHFQPTEPFIAGETVLVQLSKGIKSAAGQAMQKPFAWSFAIATAPGTLHQKLKKTIPMRLPGESWVQVYGAYAGDMNNDGYSDLVAVQENTDDLRILLNDGQGSYPDDFTLYDFNSDKTASPSEGADFNNDGEIDLVVTTAWDNEVRVMMGDGQGNFSSQKTYFTSNGVRGIVVGDFDGDGWDDMLTTNRLAGNISLFKNAGDGTFTQTSMDTPGDETSCALTDANGDGILDVFFATYNGKKIGVLLGDGAGNFNLFGTPVTVVGKPWMIGAGDFNGDGKADVASANSDGNRTVVLFGDGAGGLTPPVNLTAPQHIFPLAIDAGDIDGDGDLDMVTSNYQSSTYTVFENDGAGQFTAAETLIAPEASSCAILHDRDNDGDLDITGTDEEADVILLFENADSTVSGSGEVLSSFGLNVYPNPAANQVRVAYFLEENSEVSMILSNEAGQVVSRSEKKFQPVGNHVETWDVPGRLATGTYVLELFANGKSVSQKLIVVDR